MISILIPIYNFEVGPLVKDLHGQAMSNNIDFEICCFDDGSDIQYKLSNRTIAKLENVVYKELEKNLGRAKIRNELGKVAKYPYLIFMDCDSKVIDNQYITKYIQNLEPTTLLYGGRIYANSAPIKDALKLHFYYGKIREEITTEERKISPYHNFMTNNFLIPQALFLDILFEESIEGYGHEDTLFGMALKQKGIKILHINNPLEHLGLEETNTFLRKQKTAIKNLYLLHKKSPLLETKLLATFVRCKKWGIDGLIRGMLTKLSPIIQRQLRKNNPNLFFLDLFKLQYLLEIDKNGINNLPS